MTGSWILDLEVILRDLEVRTAIVLPAIAAFPP